LYPTPVPNRGDALPNPIEQILALLSGSAPNQSIPGEGGFEVQAPSGGNIPPQSEFIGGALNELQQAGVAPPLPAETGSGQGTLQMLMQILQAIASDAGGPVPLPGGGNDGGAVPLPGVEQPNPDPGFTPGGAAQGSDANRELLEALLSGSVG
jgi:hypothetical protein